MTLRFSHLAIAVTTILLSQPGWADDDQVERIEVVGSQGNITDLGTGLGLDERQTPQSMTVIGQDVLSDYRLSTLNEVLDYTPGVTVERVETDRTYFTSRGFEINNIQVDGLGAPFYADVVNGDIDLSMYDQVQVLRGAGGLMAGIGNPAATINLVRKRPTDDTRGYVNLSAGRWNDYRGEVDVSGSLASNLRGRLVGSYQDKDSYIDLYSKTLSSLYGVLDTHLGDNTLLTVGVNYQESKPESPMWGALTLAYTDGSPTHFDRSSSTSADWAYWNSYNTQAFAELEHRFANGWRAKLAYNYRGSTQSGDLFYVYGTIDRDSNVGLTGYASRYTLDSHANQVDLSLSGQYQLWGQSHELMLGANWVQNQLTDQSLYDYLNGFPPIGDFTQWQGQAPYPNLVDGATGSDIKDTQKAIYGATRLNITDALHVIAGSRVVRYHSQGTSYDQPEDTKVNDKVIPYGGVVYDLTDALSLYTSYAKTFDPQTERTLTGHMAPSEGKTLEGGIKGEWFNGGLNASLSVFKNEFNNLATSVGRYQGQTIYEGRDFQTKGFEAQLSGELSDEVSVLLGYTQQNIEDADGNTTRRYVPKQSFKALASYSPSQVEGLKLGASMRWQSNIYVDATYNDAGNTVRISQGAFALYGLFAKYQFTPNITGQLNLNNITDKSYYSSLYWDQAFYGSPRSYTASLTWRF